MRIALQLSGYFNNRADSSSGLKGSRYLYENLINPQLEKGNEIDIFVHSWDLENQLRIEDIYEPDSAIFQPQIDFSEVIQKAGLSTQERYDKGFNRSQSLFAACKLENTLSFLYGRYACNLLRKKDSGDDYDAVIVTRFDCGQRDWPGARFRTGDLIFRESSDMSKLHVAYWDQMNAGYTDQWFYGSPEVMNTLCNAYRDAVTRHFLPNSSYEKAVTTGWPDSRPVDVLSTLSPGQFTNEALLPDDEKSEELMKFPLWQCINNHMLYKWIAIDTGLYERTEHVKKEENGNR